MAREIRGPSGARAHPARSARVRSPPRGERNAWLLRVVARHERRRPGSRRSDSHRDLSLRCTQVYRRQRRPRRRRVLADERLTFPPALRARRAPRRGSGVHTPAATGDSPTVARRLGAPTRSGSRDGDQKRERPRPTGRKRHQDGREVSAQATARAAQARRRGRQRRAGVSCRVVASSWRALPQLCTRGRAGGRGLMRWLLERWPWVVVLTWLAAVVVVRLLR